MERYMWMVLAVLHGLGACAAEPNEITAKPKQTSIKIPSQGAGTDGDSQKDKSNDDGGEEGKDPVLKPPGDIAADKTNQDPFAGCDTYVANADKPQTFQALSQISGVERGRGFEMTVQTNLSAELQGDEIIVTKLNASLEDIQPRRYRRYAEGPVEENNGTQEAHIDFTATGESCGLVFTKKIVVRDAYPITLESLAPAATFVNHGMEAPKFKEEFPETKFFRADHRVTASDRPGFREGDLVESITRIEPLGANHSHPTDSQLDYSFAYRAEFQVQPLEAGGRGLHTKTDYYVKHGTVVSMVLHTVTQDPVNEIVLSPMTPADAGTP